MTRSPTLFALTLGLLAGAGALLVVPSLAREVPLAAPLDTLPASFGGWVGSNDVPSSVLPVDPQASAHLLRTYRNGDRTLWISVSYYSLQSESHRLSTLELLDPNHGWSIVSARTIMIPVREPDARSIPANLVLVRGRGQALAMLYWYQVQGHSIASDHWYRVVLVYNRLIHHRGDGASIRVAAAAPDAIGAEATVEQAMGFIQAFYPEILRSLPQ